MDYPQPRLKISVKHAVIVAVGTVVVLLAWLIFNLPGSQKPQASEVIAGLEAGSKEANSDIVVSVVGHVHKPGLYYLELAGADC